MKELKGTLRLTRLALRRDRVKLPIVIASVALMTLMFLAAVKELFAGGDEAARNLLSHLAANPVMRLFGLPTGSEMGNFFMLRTFTFIAIVVALVSTFTAIRHTRQNEEKGRTELIGSNPVGRHASLTAAIMVVVGTNAAIVLVAGLCLIGGGLPAAGVWAMALGWGAIGITFGAIAAVCGQLTKTSGSANSLAAATVGVAFLLAGIGSVLGSLRPDGFMVDPVWVTWLSPIGWGQLIYPFADENWWMLAVFAGFIITAVAVALFLTTKRDIGAGMLQSRQGRATAGRSLLSPGGLTWRLNRGVFFGWLIGLALLGMVYGAVAGGVEELFAQAEGVAELFTASTGTEEIITAYLGTIMGILGLFTLGYAIQITLRLRSEENRALEVLLSVPTSRVKWLLVNFAFVAVSAAAILVFAGLGAGLTAQLTVAGEMDIFWPLIAGGLVQLPAILLIAAFVAAVFGLWPRLSHGLAWPVLAISVLLGPIFSAMLNVPDWLLNVSPLSHTPAVPPTANIEALPLAILTGIAAVLLAVALVAFRRRDVTTS